MYLCCRQIAAAFPTLNDSPLYNAGTQKMIQRDDYVKDTLLFLPQATPVLEPTSPLPESWESWSHFTTTSLGVLEPLHPQNLRVFGATSLLPESWSHFPESRESWSHFATLKSLGVLGLHHPQLWSLGATSPPPESL